MIKYVFIIWVSKIKLVELSKLLWKHKIWSLLQDFSSCRRLSYILIYVIPQGKDTALWCRFRCQNYLSLSWDFFRVLCCLPSACNRLSWSRTLSLSGGAYRSFSAGLRLSLTLRSNSASCCFRSGSTLSCKCLISLALSCTLIIRLRIWRNSDISISSVGLGGISFSRIRFCRKSFVLLTMLRNRLGSQPLSRIDWLTFSWIYESDISKAMAELPEGSTLSEQAEAEVKRAVLLEELSGLIYLDPTEHNENNLNAGWKTADEYLSGKYEKGIVLCSVVLHGQYLFCLFHYIKKCKYTKNSNGYWSKNNLVVK